MYSSPHSVGPVALLECYVAEIVDEYFEDHPWLESEDDEDIELVYQHVLKEINIEYLRKVVRWKLEELNNDEKCEDMYFKSKDLLFKRMNIGDSETYNSVYDIENERESDLLVKLSNIIDLKDQKVIITINKVDDNEFDISFSFNEKLIKFWLSLHDEQKDGEGYIYVISLADK